MFHVRASILAKKIVAGCVLGGCVFFIPHGVQSATDNSATLQWAANLESDLAGYRIYRGTAPGIYGVSQSVGKTPTYQYTNLEPNKTHYFTITAYDTSGNESLPSLEVSKTIAGSISQTVSNSSTTSNNQVVATGGTTGGTSSFPPSMVSPASGSTLTSTSVTFTGAHTSQDLEHSLRIGTSNGAADIYSKSMGTGHSVTVSDLPSTGTIYVWYWTRNTNDWFVNTVTYTMNAGSPSANTSGGAATNTSTASNSQAGATGGTTGGTNSFPPSMVSPAPGSTLTSTSVVFTGAHTSQDLEHSLRIGTSNGAADIYSKSMGTGHSVTVSDLPSTGTIYVWYWTRNTNDWFVHRVTYTMNVGSPPAHTSGGAASHASTASNSQMEPSTHTANSTTTASTNVFWRNTSSGEVAVWLMNGLTITSVGFPGSTSTDWKIEQVGDMNGDGQSDVLWRNSNSGVVAIWLMNNATIISSGFLGGVPADWRIKGIGDVNGDGKGDVIWRNSSNGLVAIWFMNGLTTTSVGYLGSAPLAWEIERVGDMNGDGKADLIWQNQTNGTVAVWLMSGLTVTSVGFPASTPMEWKLGQVGDVNGDGKMDMLWRNRSNGMVAVWLMNGTTIVSHAFLGGVPSEWEIKQVSDMNGDGKADVVLQNQTSGVVAVWLMNGSSISSVGLPGSTPANWKIQR